MSDATNETNVPGPGVHRDVPADEYYAWPLPSNSLLGHLARSPLHCRHALDHPAAPTPDMRFGTAFHSLVLEPADHARRYVRAGRCSGVLKSGKRAGLQCESDGTVHHGGAWFCGTHAGDRRNDPGGPEVLGEDDAATLGDMAAAVAAHPWAGAALALPGMTEVSIVFDDRASGVRCKMRADRIVQGDRLRCVIDLKTARDASPDAFARTIHERGYHRQAALYLRGCAAAGIDVDGYAIVAVDKEPPHATAVYQLDDQDLQAGGDEVDRLLALYAECAASGRWPGYGDGVTPIRLPAWARRRAGADAEHVMA
jgi:hypothetical protein